MLLDDGNRIKIPQGNFKFSAFYYFFTLSLLVSHISAIPGTQILGIYVQEKLLFNLILLIGFFDHTCAYALWALMHRFLSVRCHWTKFQNQEVIHLKSSTVADMFPTLDQQLCLLNKHADVIPIAMYNLMRPEPSQLGLNSRRLSGSLQEVVSLHIASLCKYWELQGATMDN